MNEVMETEVLETEDAVLEIEGEEVITEDALETVETTGVSEEVPAAEFNFNPGNFVANLKYMGLGMLGIFVVIGIIIIVTSLLSKVKTKDAE